ncbi:MAG: hypothetical protein N3G74_01005 [Candidatus Micrarchaeota archaeon]|nr:hypothetical protein [Candidatus Micrarchaeota archaeon]
MVVTRIREHVEKTSKRRLIITSLIVGGIFGIVFGYILIGYMLMNAWDLPFLSLSKPKYGIEMSMADISAKVTEYLNVNFLKSYNANAAVKNITQVSGISILKIDIMQNGNKISEGEVYVTNDGQFMMVGALYNMSKSIPQIDQQIQTQPEEIPKTEKPNVKLFVMSYCPYGQQAENAMWPVLDILGDKINFELHFVVYPSQYYAGQEDKYCLNKTYCSMHGIQELNENIRQMCIKDKYDYSVWKEYIKAVSLSCNYQNVDSCWESIAKSKGIDVEYVKNCYDKNAIEYAKQEYELNKKYGVQGSPTLFINDVEYSGGRTPEAYKQTICSAFLTRPNSCDTALSSESGTVSGSCG